MQINIINFRKTNKLFTITRIALGQPACAPFMSSWIASIKSPDRRLTSNCSKHVNPFDWFLSSCHNLVLLVLLQCPHEAHIGHHGFGSSPSLAFVLRLGKFQWMFHDVPRCHGISPPCQGVGGSRHTCRPRCEQISKMPCSLKAPLFDIGL